MKELGLLDLLLIFARRRFAIAVIIAVFTIYAVVAASISSRSFTAVATFIVPSQGSLPNGGSGSSALGLSVKGLSNLGFNTNSPTVIYSGLLRSRVVEDAIVRRFHLMGEYHTHLLSVARRSFEQHSKVDCRGMDGFIRIWVTDPSPQRAAAMTNAFVDLFHTLLRRLETSKARKRRVLFEQQLSSARGHLAGAERSLALTEQKTGLITVDSQTRALIDSAAALRAEIATEKVLISSLGTYASGENPKMVQARTRLGALQSQLAKLTDTTSTRNASLLIPGRQMPKARMQFERDIHNVEYYETMVDILAKRFEMAKVDEARPVVVQVVDAATPPEKPSSPRPALMITGAFLAGILAGMFWAIAAYGFERLRSDPSGHAKLTYLWQVSGISRIWRAQAKA